MTNKHFSSAMDHSFTFIAVLVAVAGTGLLGVTRSANNPQPTKVEHLAVRSEDLETFGRPLDDVIMPQFWTGKNKIDSSVYEIDCSGLNLTDPAVTEPTGAFAQRVREVYDRVGLVLFTHTGLGDNMDAMRALSLLTMGGEMQYEGGANARDAITKNVYDVGAPLIAHLHYHHEMTYVRHSTAALSFMCTEELPDRGATFASEGVATTEAILATPLGQKLKEKGVCFHRELTDRDAPASQSPDGRPAEGVYNHWQHSFSTKDPQVAQRLAEERGLIVDWVQDSHRGRVMRTRFYADAFEYFEGLDRNLLYASLADHGMWFDSWPYVQHLPYDKRPLDLTYGDDTPFTTEERQLFIDVYDHQGVKLDWRNGDVAVMCNLRWAHGRPGIHLKAGETRRLGVVLGPKFERVGQLDGKW